VNSGRSFSTPVLFLALGLVAVTSVTVAYANGAIDFVGDIFVDGAVTIQDGTEGLGKVFTSDSVGTGSWQDPAPTGLMQTPIGTVLSYAGSTAPTNYMIADGSEISRTTFPELFSIIGTTYGAGDGSTTFNLPELSDKFIRGTFPSVTPGIIGGAASHKHGIDGIALAVTFPEDIDLTHNHGVDPPSKQSSLPLGTDAKVAADTTLTPDIFVASRFHSHNTNIPFFETKDTSLSGLHDHRFSIPFQESNFGSTLPPFIELVMIIRVQ